tara:strand:+ start:69 stop:755 length:687 start_codon:yes stop_codon:yes gene_type:complete
MSETFKNNNDSFNNLVYKSGDFGDISGAILNIFVGKTVKNILPERFIFWERYDDPMIVLRDIFATEEERENYLSQDVNKSKITVEERKGGGKKEKTIYGKLYNELKISIKKLTEEEEDLEFIIENYEELKKTVEKAVEKTKNKTKNNISELKKIIKENYEILQKLNNVKLDLVTFLLKNKKNKKIHKETMKKIKKLYNENKSLKSIKEFKLFNKKVLDLKNKLNSSSS